MQTRNTILVAESRSFAPEAERILSRVGQVLLADLDRQGLECSMQSVDVLWVRLRHRITEELMTLAPRLRVIATPTVGLHHIDVRAAERRGICVISLRGDSEFLRSIRATAEHTLALTLGLLRHLPQSLRDVRLGAWDRDRFRGSEIYGKTVGVIGYGRLGQIVSGYFQAFGARVLVCDPALQPDNVPGSMNLLGLDEVLHLSDIVTLHVNLASRNVGFFGPRCFMKMKRGSYLINTSRGEVIDERALLTALRTGKLAGAALDVVCGEPDGALSPLVDYARQEENLLITPHIGGCTRESMERTEVFLATRVAEWLQPGAAA